MLIVSKRSLIQPSVRRTAAMTQSHRGMVSVETHKTKVLTTYSHQASNGNFQKSLACLSISCSNPVHAAMFCLIKLSSAISVRYNILFTSHPKVLCSIAVNCKVAATFHPSSGCIPMVAEVTWFFQDGKTLCTYIISILSAMRWLGRVPSPFQELAFSAIGPELLGLFSPA